MLVLAFLVFAVQWAHVAARSSGDVPEACDTMTPQHGPTAQMSDPPFAVTFDAESYTPGTPVTVTIRACGSGAFKGFMIQAQRASTAAGTDTAPLGRFNVLTGTKRLCTGDAALVHTDSSEKTSLPLIWNPPTNAVGHIVFRVTFVQSRPIFWTKVTSAVLRDASISGAFDPDANAQPTTVAASCGSTSQGDSVAADPGCGTTKGCFNDCQDSTCTFSISWQENGDFGTYTLQADIDSPNSYIALGFSEDRMMGNDSVTGCKLGDTAVTVFNAKTAGEFLPTEFTDADVTLQESSFQNNILTCTFQQPKAASADGNRFDLLQNWTLLFSKGNLESNGDLIYHDFRIASNDKYALTVTSTNTDNTGTPPTEPPPTGNVVRDPACGVSKGCYTQCQGSACKFVVSWVEDGSFGVYTLSADVGPDEAWIALGFSTDGFMGGDSITGCAVGSDNTVVLFNGQTTTKVRPTLFTDNGVSLTTSSFSNGMLTCTFRRNTSASDDGRRFDITQSFTYLFAIGAATVSNGVPTLSYHGIQNRFKSGAQFSVSDTTEAGAAAIEFPLIKAHGSLMIGAWIFFASIGIVAARYCKLVWKDLICSNKVWFQIHRTCMVLVFCCTVAGFVIIFVEIGDWSEIQGEDYQKAHPILGVIVTSLAVINPLMALIRPHPGTPHRPIFNWAHWFVGTCAHILGVITVFFGTKLGQADAPDYLIYILAGYVAWQVLVEFVLTGIQCCCVQRDKKEVYELSGQNDVAQRQSTVVETEQALTLKKIIFVVHVFVVTSITAVLIGLLAVGKTELDK